MSEKQKFLFLFLIFFVSQVFPEIVFGQANLEVLYPEIFGKAPGPGVSLPKYIEYIYLFAVTIIGLIIFGVLIYNGISYLLSAGNVEKLSEAKKGILAGFLGGVILLSAVLIFNALSPHLAILKPPPIGELVGVIPSGVYICNHKVNNIEAILNNYLGGDEKTKREATKEFMKAIYKGVDKYCERAKSGKTVMKTIKTMFVVPESKYDPVSKKYFWEYTEAIIIKDEEKYVGGVGTKCNIFPQPQGDKIFRSQVLYGSFLHGSFAVDEILRIKKHPEPLTEGGVILYEGVARNTIGKYVEGKLKEPAKLNKVLYRPNSPAEIKIVTKNDLEAANLWESNKNLVKSIEVDPPKKYLAVMQGTSTWLSIPTCTIIDETENNLGRIPIGRCGTWCAIRTKAEKASDQELDDYCYSCFDELMVISGSKK